MTVRRVRGKPMINIPKDFGVGFTSAPRYPDGTRVVDVAVQNEFGDSLLRRCAAPSVPVVLSTRDKQLRGLQP